MHPIGFSTGALAKSDFRRGLELQRVDLRVNAVELSALRLHELESLVNSISSLDLAPFNYVSFHAPSVISAKDEHAVLELLTALPGEWPIVVHPEIMFTPSLWSALGARLCIENMDNRKRVGRTAGELRGLLCSYPEATFCLDVGHARQVDPTMATAMLMLMEHNSRLRQLHVSNIGTRGEHLPLSVLSQWAYERIAHLVPKTCPLIIESAIPADAITREIDVVTAAFG